MVKWLYIKVYQISVKPFGLPRTFHPQRPLPRIIVKFQFFRHFIWFIK